MSDLNKSSHTQYLTLEYKKIKIVKTKLTGK